MSPVGSLD